MHPSTCCWICEGKCNGMPRNIFYIFYIIGVIIVVLNVLGLY